MPKIYSPKTKQKACDLRSRGWSIGEISLKMRIPKNTLSGWVRDIRLNNNQIKRIKEKEISCRALGRVSAAKLLREKMEKWKQGIREKIKYFEQFPSRDPEIGKLICGILYLCEGAKYPASRFLHFGNSDSKIIHFFINLLRKTYTIDEDKLRFSIGYRYDQDYEELKNYWSKITKIPKIKCLKSKPDLRTKGKPTLKKDYKGVCRIVYYSTDLQFELLSIGEAIINGAEGS